MSESKYKPEYCEVLKNHLAEGFSLESCLYKLGGACKAVVYDWVKKYPEFAQAKKEGEAMGLEYDEKLLKVLTLGIPQGKLDPKKMNVAALLFKLKTMRHKVYSEKIHHEIGDETKEIIKLAYKKKTDE